MPGTGIRIAGVYEPFLELADKLGIAVAPAWNAQDLVPDDHPLYVGRPGTVGDRSGNFAVQCSDLLLVLGCRLNIRQISRSEEHTSELQSLMRISYAVFCLKKTKKKLATRIPSYT